MATNDRTGREGMGTNVPGTQHVTDPAQPKSARADRPMISREYAEAIDEISMETDQACRNGSGGLRAAASAFRRHGGRRSTFARPSG